MRRILRIAVAAFSCAVAVTAAGGCSSLRFAEGSTPFPAKIAIMSDEAGRPLTDLPPSTEPIRVIILDFPWCPPCADAWDAIAAASKSVPAGRVRVYRVLFDREKYDTVRGTVETAPLRPAPPPPPIAFPVTTVTALPAQFREKYKVEQAPMLLLSDPSGKILKRWIGYTPGLAESLRNEISQRLVK